MAIFIPPQISSTDLKNIVLEAGELVYNKDDKQFYTGDGVTVGGISVFNENKTNNTEELVAQINNLETSLNEAMSLIEQLQQQVNGGDRVTSE